MKLVRELTLAASPRHVFDTLQDLPRAADALPGATIAPESFNRAYHGTFELGQAGPVYHGTAEVIDVDEDEQVVTVGAFGRVADGDGAASAEISCRIEGAGERTRLVIDAELWISDQWTRPRRAAVEAAASGAMAQFAGALERQAERLSPATDDPGRALIPSPLSRAALAGAGVCACLAIARAIRRR